MAKKNTKLELTWVGKENRPKLEPRILIEEPDNSYHAAHRVGEKDIFDNRLIFGDNLLALKALEQEFTERITCVFIDPPYNTGSAFTHYDDGVEHSLWLSLMHERLSLLWRLLSIDGSIWITIDDTECHYLKVMCDELFGRACFVCSFAWEKDQARHNDALISSAHDHILLYVRDVSRWRVCRNLLPREESNDKRYKNPDNDPRGVWLQGACSTAKSGSEKNRFPVRLPSGRDIVPPPGNYWRFSEKRLKEARAEDRVYFGKDGDRLPIIKSYLSEVQQGYVPKTWWPATEVGSNQSAKRDHLRKLLHGIEPFSTPKPEGLLERIVRISTNPGDTVLDSFAGSGTTGAVAHKMGRRWIMVELEQTCHTHIAPRIRKVIDSEDPGGITDAVDWGGGGGFRYYKLGPTLIVEDEWGNPVINPEFNAAMLTEAMCKLEGFSFDPDPEVYWQQGHSTETDFIYVTTQFMSKDMLTKLSDEVGPNRSLLINCSAFRCNTSQFENLTVKKIPKAVLKKCEWGHDDYSLEIENLPDAPADYHTEQEDKAEKKKPARKFGKGKDAGPTLFDMAPTDSKGGK